MSESPTSCYVSLNEIGPHGGELFETTMLARASWYENGQHGGVLAALMTRAVDRQPSLTSMEVARVTVELFRVVPVDRLEVVTNLIREGKKIQTTEVRLYVGELEVAHGLVQRLRVTDLDRDFENTPAPAPLIAADVGPFGNVMPFPSDAGVGLRQNLGRGGRGHRHVCRSRSDDRLVQDQQPHSLTVRAFHR